MIIRSIKQDDFDQIKLIYEKYYSKEFEFPDFITHYLSAFVVTDDTNKIITVAGVRTILEAVMMTDINTSNRTKMKAFHMAKEQLLSITCNSNYNELHALSFDPKWTHLMKRGGFEEHPGTFLVY